MRSFLKCLVLALVVTFGAGTLAAQQYKIRQTTSFSGQKSESTIYVKSPRKRTEGGGIMGIGGDVATIEQCDLKRNVKISDKKKQYFVSPFATAAETTGTPGAKAPTAPVSKATKGGTVTVTSAINDTGERKQMFGLTARHIKTSMRMESSPDACSPANMHIETDGWYVDLPQFSCPVNMAASSVPYQRPARSGCQDRTVLKETGGGKLGFALQMTSIMDNGDGQTMTQTTDTIELSKATLEDALFEIPAGYTLAKQEQDLYGRPDFSAMMRGANNDNDDDEKPSSGGKTTSLPTFNQSSSGPTPKRPGVKRIGVLVPTNASSESISMTSLQEMLVNQLTSGSVDAVAVSSEADAKAAGCDFILTSNFSKLKKAGMGLAGGIMGKITNTDMSTWDAQVDYVLTAAADGRSVLTKKAALKGGGNSESVAQSALAMEASEVLKAVR